MSSEAVANLPNTPLPGPRASLASLLGAVRASNTTALRVETLLLQTLQSITYVPFAAALTWLIDNVLREPGRWPNVPQVLLIFAITNLLWWWVHARITLRGFAHAQRIVRNTIAHIRIRALHQLERLSLSYFQKRGGSAIANQLIGDLAKVEGFLGHIVSGFVAGIVLGIVTFVYLAWKNSTLALLTLSIIPLQFLVLRFGRKQLDRLQSQVQSETEDFARDIAEFVAGMRVLRSFAATSVARDRIARSIEKLRETGIEASVATMRLSFIIQVAYQYLPTLVWCVGGLFMLRGRVTVGELVAFVGLLAYVQHGLTTLTSAYEQWIAASPGLRATQALLAQSDELEDLDATGELDDQPVGDISFDQVTFTHADAHTPVFKHFSLRLQRGQSVALVGESGAGKSTLLDLLMLFVRPSDGHISFGQDPSTPASVAWVRRHLAVMGQEPYLFRASILENIRLAKPDASRTEVEAAVRAAGAEQLIARLPEGLGTMVTERGHSLSGGERQRIALARIFLRAPDVVILDEPTSALDEATEQAILPYIRALCEGRTAIVVTHRPALLSCVDRIIELKRGIIVRDSLAATPSSLQ